MWLNKFHKPCKSNILIILLNKISPKEDDRRSENRQYLSKLLRNIRGDKIFSHLGRLCCAQNKIPATVLRCRKVLSEYINGKYPECIFDSEWWVYSQVKQANK